MMFYRDYIRFFQAKGPFFYFTVKYEFEMEGRVHKILWYFLVFPYDVLCLLRITI